MKLIVDRIEGEILVAELPDGRTVNLPLCICENASEGDVLKVSVLDDETNARRTEIEQKMQDLFR